MTINRTIGTRIAACRAYRNLTPAALAEQAGGMTGKLITRIERGTAASVTAENLVKLAKALGVKSSVLTGEDEFSTEISK